MKFSPMFLAIGAMLAPFATQAAMYQLKEIAKPDTYKQSFPAALNNANQALVNLNGMYSFPVDLNAIDVATSAYLNDKLTAVELEDLKRGNISANAQAVLEAYLQENSSAANIQRFASVFAFRGDSQQVFKWRETATVPTNNEYFMDINDEGSLLGVATTNFKQQTFLAKATNEQPNPVPVKVWVPEPMFVAGMLQTSKGKFMLKPPYTEYGGGFSFAKAMSNSGYIVGYGSVGMSQASEATMKSLCTGESQPQLLCYYNYTKSGAYDLQGLIWRLNVNGVPEVTRQLKVFGDRYTGKPHTLAQYPAVTYLSTPLDVNEKGIAVGTSVFSDSADIRYSYLVGSYVHSATHAAVFDGDEVRAFINTNDYLSSQATAINNKNIVVGSASKVLLSYPRDKMFVYNYDTDTIKWVTDLFDTASTTPAAINDQNYVVGTTEVFTAGTSTRRNVGFLADVSNDKFYDLNTLVGCDNKYNIVAATSINEKNVVLATAIIEVDKRDAKGELMKDSAGNQLKENKAVPVQLTPIANGKIDECVANKNDTYERQGAATSTLGLLLLPLALWRRRRQH